MGENWLYVREKKSIEEGQNPDHESIQNSFLYGNWGKITDSYMWNCVRCEINRMYIKSIGT